MTDRDSMIYSDGAGASIIKLLMMKLDYYLEWYLRMDEANYLFFGKSYNRFRYYI
jgi:hypothetical protein